MNQLDAEKLLGGHATGTLTEAERQALYAAALEHQAVFDALMDEEALRELLADPAAKAQLLEALAPAAPRVVPLWRRTGVLGAAASLLVASLAGIAYLRSPEKTPPTLRQAPGTAATAKPAEPASPAAPAPDHERKRATPRQEGQPASPAPPPPPPPPAPNQQVAQALTEREDAYLARAEKHDRLAKKAEAPRAAMADAAPAPEAKAKAMPSPALGVSGGVISSVVGGVASGASVANQAPPAKAARRLESKAVASTAPAWSLEPRPDGTTRVHVRGALGATAVLLRRGASGIEALPLKPLEPAAGQAQWETELRLAPGDRLDLYLLNAPVAEPAKLPETGPVDGFRARIHPATK